MSFLRGLFGKTKSEIKPEKPRTIQVSENEFAIVPVSSEQPYKVYSAFPMFSCFAYLFIYSRGDKQKEVILYHANGGVLDKAILDNIHKRILDSKASPNDVDIVIAMSGKNESASVNLQIHAQSIELLSNSTYQFNKDRISTIDRTVMMYAVDTLGNHGETVSREKTATPSISR